MTRRSYGQYCGLAHALDLVGERWTLLVVRDLALGPKRFSDVLAGLPGLGTSLLSDRLRQLENNGLVERALADRAVGVVYRLTEDGEQLATALGPLTVWGAAKLADEPAPDEWRPEWLAFVLMSTFRHDQAAGIDDCYEFRLGDANLFVIVADGTIAVSEDKRREPDLVATLDLPTLAAIGSGNMSVHEAINSGKARFEGDPDAGARAMQVFGS